ncbi:hypothetical protein ACH47X_05995 [Promicromonospora kroppenstedtii]|uniref:Uncharacterized protein n=1 Tax=Promicromonospora kroppenstedtii TaxID=440482 RepID=A0ABW7XGI5_9MICO
MSVPPPEPPAPGPAPRRTGPKVLTFTALGVLLVGMIVAVVGFAAAARGIVELVPTDLVTSEGTAGSDALALGPSTTPVAFDVQERGAYLVVEVSRDSSTSLPTSSVSAQGPSGPVRMSRPDQPGSLEVNGWAVHPVGIMVPDEDGTHAIVVDPQVATDDVSIAVSGPFNAESVAGIGGSGLVLLLGLLIGGLGFLLLIGGIIWWALAKK